MEQTVPKVSIIVPCYNSEPYLDAFFKSILADSYARIELIMVNDGSTDGTESKILSYRTRIEQRGGKLLYVCQENQGAAAAISSGLKVFTGDYLIWPDSDDELMNDSISERVAYMEAHKEIALLITNFVSVREDEPEKVVCNYRRILGRMNPETFFDDVLEGGGLVGPPVYMARGAVVRERIPDGEIFSLTRSGQNYQMLLSVCYNNKVAILPDMGPHYKYFLRPSSHSHTNQKDRESAYAHYDRIGDSIVETMRRLPGVDRSERQILLERAVALKKNLQLTGSYVFGDDSRFRKLYRQYRNEKVHISVRNRIRRIIIALPGLKCLEQTLRKWR